MHRPCQRARPRGPGARDDVGRPARSRTARHPPHEPRGGAGGVRSVRSPRGAEDRPARAAKRRASSGRCPKCQRGSAHSLYEDHQPPSGILRPRPRLPGDARDTSGCAHEHRPPQSLPDALGDAAREFVSKRHVLLIGAERAAGGRRAHVRHARPRHRARDRAGRRSPAPHDVAARGRGRARGVRGRPVGDRLPPSGRGRLIARARATRSRTTPRSWRRSSRSTTASPSSSPSMWTCAARSPTCATSPAGPPRSRAACCP